MKIIIANSFALTLFASIVFCPIPGIADPTSTSPQLALVKKLYHDFAWETAADQSAAQQRGVPEQTLGVLSRYFDSSLSALIVRDEKCTKQTHEICRLDFSPIWDSQDPTDAKVRIFQGKSANTVTVNISYGNVESHELTYQLKQTSQGWRIKDIDFGSNRNSFVSILTMPR
jgi:hypothetical protein